MKPHLPTRIPSHLQECLSLRAQAEPGPGLPEVVVLEDLLALLRGPVHGGPFQVVLGVDLHLGGPVNAANKGGGGREGRQKHTKRSSHVKTKQQP